MQYTTTSQVATQLIEQSEGRVFGATTRKRTDGSRRTFNAKLPKDRNVDLDRRNHQVTVIDVNATRRARAEGAAPDHIEYRTIALERLESLSVDGKRIDF